MIQVSVVIPCFNQGQFLEETLSSLNSQIFRDFEIIIVNDGSTDEATIKVLQSIDNSNAIILNTNNNGLAAARNEGIKIAQGKYILPLDADDKIASTYLEKAVKIVETNELVKIVYCNAHFFGNQSGQWILPEYNYGKMLKQNLIFCSAMFRKKDWERVGGYNKNMKYGWEDWDFWLSILENIDGEVVKIPEVLFYYRKHTVSMVGAIETVSHKRQYLEQQLITNHINIYKNAFPEPLTLLRELDSLRQEKENFENYKYSILNSITYKLGHFLLWPFKTVFTFFKK